jgi:hypothetical protein
MTAEVGSSSYLAIAADPFMGDSFRQSGHSPALHKDPDSRHQRLTPDQRGLPRFFSFGNPPSFFMLDMA